MPYSSINQLPPEVKNLPEDAQKIFIEAFNASFARYRNEERSFAISWAAVKNAGYKKNKEGAWVKSDQADQIVESEVETQIEHVNRYDATLVHGKPKKTPQGFLKVSANLSRVGVFTYRNPNGTTRRELRLPEEVFKEDSLESLQSAPVTFGHPVEGEGHVLVNTKNIKKYQVGTLSDNIKTDEKFIAADMTIQDEKVIEAVEKGHRREVSLGYTCDLEFKPGVWNGEPYDAIQRNIVYNHAAIVTNGRAGRDVAIRMDSSDAITEYADEQTIKGSKMENTNIRVDGVDLDLPNTAAQVIQAAFAKRDSELAAAKAELESTKGQLDAVKSDLANAEKARMDAEDPNKLQAAVAARVALVSKASKVLGNDSDLTELSDRQIKESVIAKVSPDAKFDSASDEYINGRFDHVIESYQSKQDSLANAKVAVQSATAAPNKPSATDLRQAKLNAWANMHKKTLNK